MSQRRAAVRTLAWVCAMGWVAALLPTTSWAQDPVFQLKVVKILDADFNERPCSSCGIHGTATLPIGESQPGDSYVIEASVSGWDENPDIGRCDPGGDGCLLSDGDTACASKHCSDTFTSCFENADCVNNQCVRDTCLPNPAIGSFQWALDTSDTSTLHNEFPGGFWLTELPCDSEACETCQDDEFEIETCEACSCFHEVPFPGSNCTCWASPSIPACDPDSLVCHDKSSAFLDESRSDYLLFGMGTLVAVNITPEMIEMLAVINSGTGAGEGDIPSNIGTLLLTSAPCSGGTFRIKMDNYPETSLSNTDAFVLPFLPLIPPLQISYPDVADLCVGVDCDDGDPCTIDTCVNSAVCGDPPECVHQPMSCTIGQVCCDGVCQDPPCGGGNACDDFEDGVIDSTLWGWGGERFGLGGCGAGSWSWSHEEIVAPDGYLSMRVWGPTSGNTFGGQVWLRTLFDYNDGRNHIINFRWGADLNATHVDAYAIQITDGSVICNLFWYVDRNGPIDGPTWKNLYAQYNQPDLAPSDWSIHIDATNNTATLLDGPDVIGSKTLPTDQPWYIRFIHQDGTSAGFPAGDNLLNVYDFCSTPRDFKYECVVVRAPSTQDHTVELPVGPAAVGVGETFYIEFWATDSGDTNTGLVSAYADLDYPEDLVTCEPPVVHTELFSLFPGGVCDGLVVDELGGSQLAPDIGVEPEWARVAYVEFTRDGAGQADFALGPATTESSALHRGLIPTSNIDYGTCTVQVVCRCIYDLDDNCNIAGGDLGLFAPCWGCCDDEPCWNEKSCGDKDFDCNGCVSGGDLGWFAGMWEKRCDEIDPIVGYPPCRQCDPPVYCPGAASARGGDADGVASSESATRASAPDASVLLSLRLTERHEQQRTAFRIDGAGLGSVRAGEHVFVEVWARDTSPTTDGLTVVFTDVHFDPAQFEAVSIDAGKTFTLFSDPIVKAEDGVILRVGGATMEPNHGAEAWARIAVVELEALADVAGPTVSLRPSRGEAVSRRGQGLVPTDQVRVVPTHVKKPKSRSGGLRN